MFKTTLTVEGMMCEKCEAHVNKAVKKNFSVKEVTSSHNNGTTEIISDEKLDEAKLAAVIADEGYEMKGAKVSAL
ncbi:MAG: cation transporter [Clostridia bacterium]|nr:cation transporter [Clostridia bacterium]MBQ1436078.1 cation transporter [Clostridia bacterium]